VSFITKINNRYKYSFILLLELVRTDFKLRYQGSILGYLWSLLRPLAIFTVLYFVFVKFLKVGDGIPHFSIYLLVGIVLWNFFVEITSGSVGSILAKGDLIRKINFPKYVIVLATSFSAVINLILNFAVVLIFMFLFGTSVTWQYIYFVPFLLFELYVFGLSLAFILAATNIKYRDISYIWEVILQVAFYATPILYPLTMIPATAQKIILLNPVAQIIQDIRYVLVTNKTIVGTNVYSSEVAVFIPLLIVFMTAFAGMFYFKRQSKYFAERV
jgi:ABC-2 type transport system permease protein